MPRNHSSPPASVVFSVFMLVQFFANQFGFDRDGFRVPDAFAGGPAADSARQKSREPAGVRGRSASLLIALDHHAAASAAAGCSGAASSSSSALLLLAGIAGNLLSILVPYRIQPGSMKPTKMPGLAMLVMMLCQMLFPVAMAPVFVPAAGRNCSGSGPGGRRWCRSIFVLSVLLAALAAVAYWQTLGPLGRLLQRRETKILGVVTVEVE